MHVETWNILDISAVIITFAATVILYIASKRFLSKEFKKIVNWITITSFVFFVVQVTMALRIFIPIMMELTHILRAIFAILVGLCFIKTAYEINKFSKVFGFAEAEKKFAEAFVAGVKKKEK